MHVCMFRIRCFVSVCTCRCRPYTYAHTLPHHAHAHARSHSCRAPRHMAPSFQQAKKGLLTLTVRTRLTAPHSPSSHLSPPLCRSLSSGTCATKDSGPFGLGSPAAPPSTAKPNYRVMVEVSLQKGGIAPLPSCLGLPPLGGPRETFRDRTGCLSPTGTFCSHRRAARPAALFAEAQDAPSTLSLGLWGEGQSIPQQGDTTHGNRGQGCGHSEIRREVWGGDPSLSTVILNRGRGAEVLRARSRAPRSPSCSAFQRLASVWASACAVCPISSASPAFSFTRSLRGLWHTWMDGSGMSSFLCLKTTITTTALISIGGRNSLEGSRLIWRRDI